MYNYMRNNIKQMNIHLCEKIKNTSEIKRLQEITKQFRMISNEILIKYNNFGEKCIKKGWYYR